MRGGKYIYEEGTHEFGKNWKIQLCLFGCLMDYILYYVSKKKYTIID